MTMNRVRTRLRASDPLHEEPEILPEDVQRIRQRLRSIDPVHHQRVLGRALAVPIALLTVAGAGFFACPAIAQWWMRIESAPQTARSDGAPTQPAVRQVQFVTPGGTKVIWVVDTRVPKR